MSRLQYPQARTVEQVDTYHGVEVRDPYRWMENLEDPELQPWLAGQTQITEAFLSAVPCRERFLGRLRALSKFSSRGVPVVRGKRWFQSRRAADAQEGAYYVVDDPEAHEATLLLDRGAFGEGVLISDVTPSPDGEKLLWAETVGGSDWKRWRVMSVSTREIYEDEVGGAKLWAAWLPDGSGFIYIGFESPGDDRRRATFNPQLKLHRLGEPQSSDVLLYEDAESPHYFYPAFTSDGRYLYLTSVLTAVREVLVAEVDGPSWDFESLASSPEDLWVTGSVGDTFVMVTTDGASFGRVVAVDRGVDSWRTIVPERDYPLVPHRCFMCGHHVVAVHDRLGRSFLTVAKIDGSETHAVQLDEAAHFEVGSLHEPAGVAPDARSFYFAVATPRSPGTLLHHDLDTGETRTVFEPEELADLEIDAEVVWTTSVDGTKVPMTLVRKSDVKGEPDPAVVIEGYGGGGDIMVPYEFSPWKVVWLEAGGVVATAHLRGGRELGAAWQQAAARGGKLKAMEDFVGCAEYLASNLTKPSRIGVTGRSSGAMLAAAAVVARPDLFGSCVAEVGMFDPLRYHLFGLGRLMVEEYGTSEIEEDFRGMWAYTPLHRVQSGVSYPPMLLTVHTDDDRVAPGSPYKFAATLQTAQDGGGTVLLRLREGAGHFGGSASDEADERADILAFFGSTLAMSGCSPRPGSVS